MADYSTNFSDDIRGVRHTASSGQKALRPNGGASFTDGEVLAVVVPSTLSSSTRCGLYIRGSGGSGSETAYMVEIPSSGFGLQLWRFDGGGFSQLDSVSSAVFTAIEGRRYFLRLSAVGTAIKAKVWEYGEDEPASWTLSATDSAISGSGWGGLRGRGNNIYQYYAEDSDSGTAPLPADTPGANQFADDFSGQTVNDDPPSGWTEEWSTASSSWTVVDSTADILPLEWAQFGGSGSFVIEEDAGATGGKWLWQDGGGSGEWKGLLYTGESVHDDLILSSLLRVNTTTSGNRYFPGIVLRGTIEADGSLTGYVAVFWRYLGGDRHIRILRIDSGSATQLAESGSGQWADSTWYNLKFEASGTTLRARSWEDGTSEPGTWDVSTTDSDLAEGREGVTSLDTTQNETNYWDTFAVTGVSTTTTLSADPGSYAVTGSAADTVRSLLMDADPGSYSVSGQDAETFRGITMDADPGSYTVTGQAADTLRVLIQDADAGTYSVTGADAETILTGIELLAADPGSYSITGADAATLLGHVMDADPGAYSVAGVDAETTLDAAIVMDADPGSYAVTGADAQMVRATIVMDADAGSYTVSGSAAQTLHDYAMDADPGVYAIAGYAAVTFPNVPAGLEVALFNAGTGEWVALSPATDGGWRQTRSLINPGQRSYNRRLARRATATRNRIRTVQVRTPWQDRADAITLIGQLRQAKVREIGGSLVGDTTSAVVSGIRLRQNESSGIAAVECQILFEGTT